MCCPLCILAIAYLQTVKQLGEALDTLSDLQMETNRHKTQSLNNCSVSLGIFCRFNDQLATFLQCQTLRISDCTFSLLEEMQHVCAILAPPRGPFFPDKAALHYKQFEVKKKKKNKIPSRHGQIPQGSQTTANCSSGGGAVIGMEVSRSIFNGEIPLGAEWTSFFVLGRFHIDSLH